MTGRWILLAVGFALLVAIYKRVDFDFFPPEAQPEPDEPKYTYRFTGHDEALAVKAKLRRDHADRIKARAHAVESGATLPDSLRVVKR